MGELRSYEDRFCGCCYHSDFLVPPDQIRLRMGISITLEFHGNCGCSLLSFEPAPRDIEAISVRISCFDEPAGYPPFDKFTESTRVLTKMIAIKPNYHTIIILIILMGDWSSPLWHFQSRLSRRRGHGMIFVT